MSDIWLLYLAHPVAARCARRLRSTNCPATAATTSPAPNSITGRAAALRASGKLASVPARAHPDIAATATVTDACPCPSPKPRPRQSKRSPPKKTNHNPKTKIADAPAPGMQPQVQRRCQSLA